MIRKSPALFLSAAIAIVAGGCAIEKRRQTFVEADFAPFARPGTASLFGNISTSFFGLPGWLEMGNTIRLIPETPYSRDWYERTLVGHHSLEPADPRQKKYERLTYLDAQGGYRFDHIPRGNYYLQAIIRVVHPYAVNRVSEQELHERVFVDGPTTLPTTRPVGAAAFHL